MKNLLMKLVLLVLMGQIAFSSVYTLKSDDAKHLEISQNESIQWKINTYGADTIDVDIFNLKGDVDLYVKKGSAPTENDYDCRPYESGIKSESCKNISISSTDEVYITVYGYSSGTYNFKLNASLETLKSALPKSGSVAQYGWKYYPISLENRGLNTAYTMDVTITDLDHDVDLYIKNGAKPTQSDNDCSSTNGGTSSDSCSDILVYGKDIIVVGVQGYEAGNFTVKVTLKDEDGRIIAQKNHFMGEWEMVHDGWKGELKLYYALRYSNGEGSPVIHWIVGEYIGSNGEVSEVTGKFATNTRNKMDLTINSPDGASQDYELYLFTHKTEEMAEMAGITYWNDMPFGVSLYKKGKAYFDGHREGSLVRPFIAGTYKMSHDGWQGEITFIDLGNGSLSGSYFGGDGKTYAVTGTYSACEPYSPHKVRFSIHSDYTQEFEVYLFTQTKEGMAGITHWNGIPFGVRLTHLHE